MLTALSGILSGQEGRRQSMCSRRRRSREVSGGRQTDRQRCPCISKGSEVGPAEGGTGPVKGKEDQWMEEVAELELAGQE